MEKRQTWLVIGFVVLAVMGLGVTCESYSKLEKGKELFFTARDRFYNREGAREEIVKQIEECKRYFSSLEDSTEKYCWLARANFLYSDVDKAGSEKWVRAWLQAAKKAVSYDSDSGTAYALLGSAHLLLVEHTNYLGKLIHSRKAVKLLRRAIELGKDNYLAYHSLGVYYLLAPPLVGGDREKSIKLLRRGIKSSDQYISCLGNFYLAYAYEQEGDLQQAVKHIQKALTVYPNNPHIKSYRTRLNRKLGS